MNTQTEETTVPDYVLAKQELEAYFKRLGAKYRNTSGYPSTDDSGWKHNAWRFDFTNRTGAIFTVMFKTGTGLKGQPNPAEVLACHCSDVQMVEGRTFEDWASEFGYDKDSRKAEKLFRSCGANRGALVDWLACGKAGRIGQEHLESLAELHSRL